MDRTKIDPKYTRHGGAYDRGSADSWYSRGRNPHYFKEGSYQSDKVTDLTPEELAAYYQGYDDNEDSGGHKEWD